MQIKVYENSLRADRCRELLSASGLIRRYSEIILLPIPTTRDGVLLSGSETSVLDAVAYADEDTLVAGYGIPDEALEVLSSFGAAAVDVARDEGFLARNAELTATAALGILLTTERRAPSDMRIGIAGYGRIGRALFEKLMFLGASVKVFTTREALRLELAESGVASGAFPIGRDELDVDILINTAPSSVLADGFLAEWAEDIRIIDLASGAEFASGVRIERYPSLPARVYPESAGRIWAEAIERGAMLAGGGKNG